LNFAALIKSERAAVLLLTLLFLAAAVYGAPPLRYLDHLLYDRVSVRADAADPRIVLVNLDDQDLSGSEAASHRAMATVIERLAAAGARVIALDLLLERPAASDGAADPLAEAVRRSGMTLLPELVERGGGGAAPLSQALRRMMIRHVNPTDVDVAPIDAGRVRYPYEALSAAAAGLGSVSPFADNDGVVRSLPLVVAYGGRYLPSMPLALAAKYLHVPLDDIRINLGVDIELGAHNLATDGQLRSWPLLVSGDGGFSAYRFRDLLSGQVEADLFTGKIVLIGSSSARLMTSAGMMSRHAFTAQVLQGLLHDQYISRPAWTQSVEMLLLLLAGLSLALLLRLRPLLALPLSIVLGLLLLGCAVALLAFYTLWLQLAAAALLPPLGYALLQLKRLKRDQDGEQQLGGSLHETNKMLGVSFQSQGMLEQALEKFLACPADDEIGAMLYELAQAFERKRQYQQAVSCYERIVDHNADFRDAQARMLQARSAMEAQTGKDSNAALSSLLASGEGAPTLGRYEIISELGKGAMGTVYLGRDPKINRQVAIKTMALSQEFEPDELEEVKAKFFHEAEIAGMLNHPNIVTIFDAGDEHDLAYIAMEFLDGIDLVPYTKKGKLLPVATTLKIVAKVAEALQYAHAHGVIHRDIKPANIMILKSKSVKVTDFGIAHINESSKKKAGTVLGTPSYMSPEQLSGKELDGRSDLFSLGVMLYELVSGVRPFRGESISKLMFKIAKEPHVDVREHNPDVPDCVRALIDQLLTKKADLRIASAGEVMERIARCLREIRGQGGGQP